MLTWLPVAPEATKVIGVPLVLASDLIYERRHVDPLVGLIAAVPAVYVVRDWFMFRAKRGMRF